MKIIIISVSISLSCILFIFPFEALFRRKKLRRLKGEGIILKRGRIDNVLFGHLIELSKRLNRKFRLKPRDQKYYKIERDLNYTGYSSVMNVEEFWMFKHVTSLLVFVLFMGNYFINHDSFILLLAIMTGIMGFFVPDNWLHSKANKKRALMEKEVPYLLGIFSLLTDSGMNILQAIDEATLDYRGELGLEFRRAMEDTRFGATYSEAFEGLARRCDIEEISYFVSALVQGLEKGSSGLGKVVKEHAKESWNKRKSRAKELAEKASMKLFMPLLLLVLPAFVIFLLGPMLFSVYQMLG